ncbi:MAG TPA: tRNA (adenosine(37)-N6)-threonylcarbamoyltransferase complex ATPase subunit type 1 TsaE [Actinomycetota bacterium]|nr:tRNA (adenosine(37)-N6)-threonylcarbamoyltransferase complex ATPase subunit type 1 TsaE [Actinomycetota bacterium]
MAQRVLSVVTFSAEETRIVGACLAPTLVPGDVISLTGELGAGKTVFVQGLATAAGVEERVTSPTFTLVHEYKARYPLVHLDIYRLDSFQEVIDLGFEELLDPNSILLIEWGEAIGPLLPRRHLEVELRTIDPEEPDQRKIVFRPRGPDWIRKVQEMRATAETLLDAASDAEVPRPRFVVSDDPFTRDHVDVNRDEDAPGATG